MFVSRECLLEIAWHMDMGFAIFIVPLNGESDVFCCIVVHHHRVIFSDGSRISLQNHLL